MPLSTQPNFSDNVSSYATEDFDDISSLHDSDCIITAEQERLLNISQDEMSLESDYLVVDELIPTVSTNNTNNTADDVIPDTLEDGIPLTQLISSPFDFRSPSSTSEAASQSASPNQNQTAENITLPGLVNGLSGESVSQTSVFSELPQNNHPILSISQTNDAASSQNNENINPSNDSLPSQLKTELEIPKRQKVVYHSSPLNSQPRNLQNINSLASSPFDITPPQPEVIEEDHNNCENSPTSSTMFSLSDSDCGELDPSQTRNEELHNDSSDDDDVLQIGELILTQDQDDIIVGNSNKKDDHTQDSPSQQNILSNRTPQLSQSDCDLINQHFGIISTPKESTDSFSSSLKSITSFNQESNGNDLLLIEDDREDDTEFEAEQSSDHETSKTPSIKGTQESLTSLSSLSPAAVLSSASSAVSIQLSIGNSMATTPDSVNTPNENSQSSNINIEMLISKIGENASEDRLQNGSNASDSAENQIQQIHVGVLSETSSLQQLVQESADNGKTSVLLTQVNDSLDTISKCSATVSETAELPTSNMAMTSATDPLPQEPHSSSEIKSPPSSPKIPLKNANHDDVRRTISSRRISQMSATEVVEDSMDPANVALEEQDINRQLDENCFTSGNENDGIRMGDGFNAEVLTDKMGLGNLVSEQTIRVQNQEKPPALEETSSNSQPSMIMEGSLPTHSDIVSSQNVLVVEDSQEPPKRVTFPTSPDRRLSSNQQSPPYNAKSLAVVSSTKRPRGHPSKVNEESPKKSVGIIKFPLIFQSKRDRGRPRSHSTDSSSSPTPEKPGSQSINRKDSKYSSSDEERKHIRTIDISEKRYDDSEVLEDSQPLEPTQSQISRIVHLKEPRSRTSLHTFPRMTSIPPVIILDRNIEPLVEIPLDVPISVQHRKKIVNPKPFTFDPCSLFKKGTRRSDNYAVDDSEGSDEEGIQRSRPKKRAIVVVVEDSEEEGDDTSKEKRQVLSFRRRNTLPTSRSTSLETTTPPFEPENTVSTNYALGSPSSPEFLSEKNRRRKYRKDVQENLRCSSEQQMLSNWTSGSPTDSRLKREETQNLVVADSLEFDLAQDQLELGKNLTRGLELVQQPVVEICDNSEVFDMEISPNLVPSVISEALEQELTVKILAEMGEAMNESLLEGQVVETPPPPRLSPEVPIAASIEKETFVEPPSKPVDTILHARSNIGVGEEEGSVLNENSKLQHKRRGKLKASEPITEKDVVLVASKPIETALKTPVNANVISRVDEEEDEAILKEYSKIQDKRRGKFRAEQPIKGKKPVFEAPSIPIETSTLSPPNKSVVDEEDEEAKLQECSRMQEKRRGKLKADVPTRKRKLDGKKSDTDSSSLSKKKRVESPPLRDLLVGPAAVKLAESLSVSNVQRRTEVVQEAKRTSFVRESIESAVKNAFLKFC
ncbi:hypothetical protein HK098_004480 [Nowakowskiella sp. JEL0407]|nr:hypothetical protein HK098_004480 [Nowakowskiella sp. JEL0407]